MIRKWTNTLFSMLLRKLLLVILELNKSAQCLLTYQNILILDAFDV
jgi:hypothetical protein